MVIAKKLKGRLSTLRNELAKDMTPPPRKLDKREIILRHLLLNLNGTCEYCGVSLNKKNDKNSGGDHFFPVIHEGKPTEFCDDPWNIIPACSTCNSSKRNLTWKEWLTSEVDGNPVKRMTSDQKEQLFEKLQRYETYMVRYCQKRTIDITLFDSCMGILIKAIEDVDAVLHDQLYSEDNENNEKSDQSDQLNRCLNEDLLSFGVEERNIAESRSPIVRKRKCKIKTSATTSISPRLPLLPPS